MVRCEDSREWMTLRDSLLVAPEDNPLPPLFSVRGHQPRSVADDRQICHGLSVLAAVSAVIRGVTGGGPLELILFRGQIKWHVIYNQLR